MTYVLSNAMQKLCTPFSKFMRTEENEIWQLFYQLGGKWADKYPDGKRIPPPMDIRNMAFRGWRGGWEEVTHSLGETTLKCHNWSLYRMEGKSRLPVATLKGVWGAGKSTSAIRIIGGEIGSPLELFCCFHQRNDVLSLRLGDIQLTVTTR